MDGIPPERVVTDSWPALHGRPVLRRTVAVSLVLFVSVAAALLVRGINTLTPGGGRETDRGATPPTPASPARTARRPGRMPSTPIENPVTSSGWIAPMVAATPPGRR